MIRKILVAVLLLCSRRPGAAAIRAVRANRRRPRLSDRVAISTAVVPDENARLTSTRSLVEER